MIVINTIIESAYTIVCEWSPDTTAHDPDALRIIEKVEETMDAFGVSFPLDEIIQPLFEQRNSSLGEPFNGLQFSYLSRQA